MAFAALRNLNNATSLREDFSLLDLRQLERAEDLIKTLLQDLGITDLAVAEYLANEDLYPSGANVSILKVLATKYLRENKFHESVLVLNTIRQVMLIDPSMISTDFRKYLESNPVWMELEAEAATTES